MTDEKYKGGGKRPTIFLNYNIAALWRVRKDIHSRGRATGKETIDRAHGMEKARVMMTLSSSTNKNNNNRFSHRWHRLFRHWETSWWFFYRKGQREIEREWVRVNFGASTKRRHTLSHCHWGGGIGGTRKFAGCVHTKRNGIWLQMAFNNRTKERIRWHKINRKRYPKAPIHYCCFFLYVKKT